MTTATTWPPAAISRGGSVSDDLLDKAERLLMTIDAIWIFFMAVGAVTGLVWLIEWWIVQ